MNRLARLAAAGLASTFVGCGHVRYSAFPTTDVAYPPHAGEVRVSRTLEPSAAVPLAVLQVYSYKAGSIDRLVPEMTRRAAALGADFVKIDRVGTRFVETEESGSRSYDCGTKEEPKTCSESYTETVHHATTQLVGRAFRTAR